LGAVWRVPVSQPDASAALAGADRTAAGVNAVSRSLAAYQAFAAAIATTRHHAAATGQAVAAAAGCAAGHRPAPGTGRPVYWVRGRRDVPPNPLGHRSRASGERLR